MLRAWLLFLLLTSAATQADACQIASLETTRLARPAAGAMSVRYGVRRHPILQVAKLHTGLDFKAQLGDPIQAVAAGRVVTVERKGEYGNFIAIDHGNGVETRYAHLSRMDVKEGDCVEGGAVIGAAGTTGIASGVHLHFEVHRNGEPFDPLPPSRASLAEARLQ